MGLVSFIAKGRKVVFQAKAARARATGRTAKKASIIRTQQNRQRRSRIKEAEDAIRTAKRGGIPFTKEQKFRLRLQARGLSNSLGSSNSSRSRSRMRNISNNSSDMNV